MIAAIGRRGELGKDNDLIFDIPGDLRFFSRTTKGHPIVMGRRTFESLPKKLPGRHHVVISKTMKSADPDIEVFSSPEDFLGAWKDRDELVFCIGGASLYAQMVEKADVLILTEVDSEAQADAFFPAFDKSRYRRTVLESHEENGLHYDHVRYERI